MDRRYEQVVNRITTWVTNKHRKKMLEFTDNQETEDLKMRLLKMCILYSLEVWKY